jgi:hypothetical protein
MQEMTEHRVEFPEGFEGYAWEHEAKGWLQGAVAIIDGRRYALTFYDPTRLSQDIEARLRLEAAQREVQRARQQRDEIEDKARREGIPPGWLR